MLHLNIGGPDALLDLLQHGAGILSCDHPTASPRIHHPPSSVAGEVGVDMVVIKTGFA